jgi:hypothetical protein
MKILFVFFAFIGLGFGLINLMNIRKERETNCSNLCYPNIRTITGNNSCVCDLTKVLK